MPQIVEVTDTFVAVQFAAEKVRNFSREDVHYQNPALGDEVKIETDSEGVPFVMKVSSSGEQRTSLSEAEKASGSDHSGEKNLRQSKFRNFLCGIPGFRTQKAWKEVIGVLYYVLILLLLVAGIAGHSPAVVILQLFLLSPALFLNETVRDRIPFFRRRRFGYSLVGFTILLLLHLVVIAAMPGTSDSENTAEAAVENTETSSASITEDTAEESTGKNSAETATASTAAKSVAIPLEAADSENQASGTEKSIETAQGTGEAQKAGEKTGEKGTAAAIEKEDKRENQKKTENKEKTKKVEDKEGKEDKKGNQKKENEKAEDKEGEVKTDASGTFYVGTLMRFGRKYAGKKVQVYVDEPEIRYQEVRRDAESENEKPFRAEFANQELEPYQDDTYQYLLLSGTVSYDASMDEVVLTDSKVITASAERSEELEKRKGEYDVIAEKQDLQAEREFKAGATEPSWDDLRRYPDQYKGKAVKLTLTMTKVEPDGILFEGDKIGVYPGTDHEVALSDGRWDKEPRYLDGDTVTFYGIADGTTVIKVKDGSGLFAKTIDKYEVPAVRIKYNEEDSRSRAAEASGSGSSDSAYDAGRKAGEELTERLDSIDWDEIQNDASDAGKRLAEYLNGTLEQ